MSESLPNSEPGWDEIPRLKIIIAAVACCLFLASLGNTIVTTALPLIVSDLGGLEHISWVVTSYLLATTMAAPIAGKLGDMFGRKIVLQIAIGVFIIGGMICGLSQSMSMLVGGRLVQGLGGGALLVVSMAVVADILPPRKRSSVQGAFGAVFGISTVIGPLVGGFVVEVLNWHWIFFLPVPVAMLAATVLTIALDSPQQKPHTIDFAGAGLLAVLLTSIIVVANIGGTMVPWASTPVYLLAGIIPLAFVFFIFVERRAAEPVLPMMLFRINNFVVSNVVGFCVGVCMFGTIAFLPMLLQVVKGLEPVESGLYQIPMMLALFATGFTSGRFITATGRYKILPTISTGVLCVATLLMTTVTRETPNWLIVIYVMLIGVGIGPVMTVNITAIQNSIPRSFMGVGTASANMFRQIGGSLGTSVYGAIFAAGLVSHLHGMLPAGFSGAVTTQTIAALPTEMQGAALDAFAAALRPTYLVSAIAAGIAFLVSLRMIEKPLSDTLAPMEPTRQQTPAE